MLKKKRYKCFSLTCRFFFGRIIIIITHNRYAYLPLWPVFFFLRPSKCRVGTEPRWFFIKGSEFNVSPLHSHYRIMGWVGIAVAGGPIQLPLGDTHKLLDRGKDAPYTLTSRGCQSALPLILIPSVRAFGRVFTSR